MSIDKAYQAIEELKAAPAVDAGALPKAWNNAWYKAGFEHGMAATVETLCGLAADRHCPKKAADWQAVYQLLIEHRFALMEQMIAGDRDHHGFIRYSKASGRYEWYQPMSEAEGYEVLKMLLEMRP